MALASSPLKRRMRPVKKLEQAQVAVGQGANAVLDPIENSKTVKAIKEIPAAIVEDVKIVKDAVVKGATDLKDGAVKLADDTVKAGKETVDGAVVIATETKDAAVKKLGEAQVAAGQGANAVLDPVEKAARDTGDAVVKGATDLKDAAVKKLEQAQVAVGQGANAVLDPIENSKTVKSIKEIPSAIAEDLSGGKSAAEKNAAVGSSKAASSTAVVPGEVIGSIQLSNGDKAYVKAGADGKSWNLDRAVGNGEGVMQYEGKYKGNADIQIAVHDGQVTAPQVGGQGAAQAQTAGR